MSRMLRQPGPAPLPCSTAAAILAGIVPEFRVAAVVVRTGGEANAVYEVRGDGAVRPLILKVYPQRWSEPWRSKVDKEAFVYRLLARHGIGQIPQILHHEPAGVPELPSAFAVMTALDGQPLSTAAGGDVEDAYEEMGRLLAAVHRVSAKRWGYVATGIVNSKPSNTAYMREQFAAKVARFLDLGGGPTFAAAIDRYVSQHADLFAECRTPALCHNDFHAGNVLVRRAGQAWQVTGFVDVENTIVADPLFDLAKTDYYTLRHSAAKRRAFLRGYGALPSGWTARVVLYCLHHALELWNWSATTGKLALLADIRTDLDRIIAGDETLVSDFR